MQTLIVSWTIIRSQTKVGDLKTMTLHLFLRYPDICPLPSDIFPPNICSSDVCPRTYAPLNIYPPPGNYANGTRMLSCIDSSIIIYLFFFQIIVNISLCFFFIVIHYFLFLFVLINSAITIITSLVIILSRLFFVSL